MKFVKIILPVLAVAVLAAVMIVRRSTADALANTVRQELLPLAARELGATVTVETVAAAGGGTVRLDGLSITTADGLSLDLDAEIEGRRLARLLGKRGGAAVTIRAHGSRRPDTFLTALEGYIDRIAPRERAAFSLEGTIDNIDPEIFQILVRDFGLSGTRAALTLSAFCDDGVYNPAISFVEVTLENPFITGRLAQRLAGIPLPDRLVVKAPLGGTADAPELDLETATIRGLLRSFSEAPGAG